MTSAIKDKIMGTLFTDSPTKKEDPGSSFSKLGPKFYFATLTDEKGNKKYMTVCNLLVNVVSDIIEDSLVVTDNEDVFDTNDNILASASYCLVSDQPIFQFQ